MDTPYIEKHGSISLKCEPVELPNGVFHSRLVITDPKHSGHHRLLESVNMLIGRDIIEDEVPGNMLGGDEKID